MGFIKNAVIGIALYEVAKYTLKKGWLSHNLNDDLDVGSNPKTPLTGHYFRNDEEDPWKNSLANDELRAPDS
ncbi:hypothetical protein LPB86_08910 [Pedobacter sp. MC2016-14]|uniref:hypothetical protein n=1 Tax=Pedobacter sp. MC2016-14 TaxID=2897327 RepID=UPI001E405576|nr:hypothetical protein [Pedobacter sp. MC2016-14]MCD0488348.1 hypothetical protein [Pedobacter sp. MC2016-14]